MKIPLFSKKTPLASNGTPLAGEEKTPVSKKTPHVNNPTPLSGEESPLSKLRAYLIENGIAGYIIPANDPYFSEYIPDRYACRAWLSGFSGSAGTLVVTRDDAALWTDSRYFVRAEQEMAGRGIELKKLKMPGTETIEEWLHAHCTPMDLIGLDGALFSSSEFERTREALHPIMLFADEDPFDLLWAERPSLPHAPAFLLDDRFTGTSVLQKHRAVVAALAPLAPEGDFIYPVVALDDIAWLFNIRGSDVAYNPVTIACAAVTPNELHLFMECDEFEYERVKPIQLSIEACDELEEEGVMFHPIQHFQEFLATYPKEAKRIINQERWSVLLHYNTVVETGLYITPDPYRGGCIAHLKARKNETEQEGFRLALKKEAVAWIRLWRYIEQRLASDAQAEQRLASDAQAGQRIASDAQAGQRLASDAQAEQRLASEALTEQLLAKKMMEFRAVDPDYRGESFAPIVGYAGNGALPHYAMDVNGATPIKPQGFLLIDSGGHYFCGTTDTTRTFALGPLNEAQKRDYTTALKGTIGLSMAKFPAGTRGAQLDVLARGPIWATGRSYLHGTGHGIGHYLNVHEGPQSIRMEENPVPIVPGMVLSNEPAIYVPEEYGIRIENMMLCVPDEVNGQGTFYAFETLTRCPIDTSAIEVSMLGQEATAWLNEYHAKVYKEIAPLLTSEEAAWLKEKTRPI